MLYSASLPYAANAAAYFAAIADLPWAVWLDSGGRGRYDILCAQPIATLVTQDTYTEITNATGVQRSASDPFELLRQQLGTPVVAIPGIPFLGGALGYWGYDLARRLFTLPTQAQETEHLPDMMVGIYDWAIVLDHQEKTTRLVSQQREQGTEQVLPQIFARLQQNSNAPQEKFKVHGRIQSNFTRARYKSAFNAIQRYLHAGDCYQVNLAQRYAARASGNSLQAYLELRRLSPAPYSAFLNFPHAQILCASPEQFLQVQQGRVETNPIKGTRPRLNNPHEDTKMAQELGHSDKDRAENLMIVDLLRNDLGKSCTPGSVQVPKLFGVESFAQVHHLVSTVTGQLAAGHDALALLRDCFPGGSVTGAPKQRAMQIIEQLEPHQRGIYCGAIGYIGFDGNMDSNITIRTLVFADGEIRFWAGGGIVADSDADAEYQETLDKAAAMLKLLQQYGGEHEREA
ncbi:MAG: para-aminobenzoate synthetase component 1 [Candidatus Nitrotoga sp. LAW]|nr:MAG: para-aminobenzoate synthetase component 1 [Candidatus Nitrotoga sp. LAW]